MRLILLLCALLFCAENSLAAGDNRQLRIFAGAGLTQVMAELIAHYCEAHSEVQIIPNYASSGTLARQLVAGAEADLFIAANPEWMDYLQARQRVAATSVTALVHNKIVCVGSADSGIKSLADLPRQPRIALGSPESVPAGRYAQQALQSAGLYQSLRDNGQLVLTRDVRQALLYAQQGLVNAAFVYATDAGPTSGVDVLFTVAQTLYPAVTYPMAITVQGRDNPQAQPFYDFLCSAAAHRIFSDAGFIPPTHQGE